MKFLCGHSKIGDTLIEVTLAVGIFSMVAVAVVSVVSGSTSNAQVALETTVTREQIDSQAEAIRFIHDSYVSSRDGKSGSDRYINLWKAITKNANSSNAGVLEYSPSTCNELYAGDNSVSNQKGFIIDTHRVRGGTPNQVVISAANNKSVFTPASTYPRIVYNGEEHNDSLIGEDSGSILIAVEGIYVVAVRDNNSTNIIIDENHAERTAAYYDFYIRSCWYGPGEDRPSTISTVIRLYDPDALPE